MDAHLFVIDASALARSVLKPDSPAANKLHALSSNKRNKFISPKLFQFEFGNIIRHNTPTEEISRQIIESAEMLPVKLLDIIKPDMYEILTLSWKLRQTFYDCSYLHLALLHDCLLLTCDKKFATSASHLGHIELWE